MMPPTLYTSEAGYWFRSWDSVSFPSNILKLTSQNLLRSVLSVLEYEILGRR
jgi:hypothetical protein